jgi:hypothetical protein
LIGGNGGVEHGPDGGRNGDHGMIGGNGGVQRPEDRGFGGGGFQPRSGFSGDGMQTRAESNRGWQSRGRMGGGGFSRPSGGFSRPSAGGRRR